MRPTLFTVQVNLILPEGINVYHLGALGWICWTGSPWRWTSFVNVSGSKRVNFPKVLHWCKVWIPVDIPVYSCNSVCRWFSAVAPGLFLSQEEKDIWEGKGHDARLGSGWDKDTDPFVLVMQPGSVFLSVKSACSSNVWHQTILDVLFGCVDFL